MAFISQAARKGKPEQALKDLIAEKMGPPTGGNDQHGPGCPVFDFFTGDLIGVFTICYKGKQSGDVHKLSIDTRSVYNFIASDSKLNYFKIPRDAIYKKTKAEKKDPEESFERGREFEIEKSTGKLQ